ncbi:hypothetical protein J3E68DRAFT_218956 [Trichoderma sp. SZMC 28012]
MGRDGGCKLEHIKLVFLNWANYSNVVLFYKGRFGEKIWMRRMRRKRWFDKPACVDSCMTGKHLDRRLELRAKQIPHVKYEGVYWTNLFVLTKAMCCIFAYSPTMYALE